MSFGDFLKFMQGPGIEAAIGFVMSFAVEWFPTWEQTEWRIKRLVLIVLSMGIPMLFAELAVLTGYQPLNWELTYWPALQAGGAFFLASQAAHIVSSNKAQSLKDAYVKAFSK